MTHQQQQQLEKLHKQILDTCDPADVLEIACECGCAMFFPSEKVQYLPVTNPKNTTKHPITGQPYPLLTVQRINVCANCGKPMDFIRYVSGQEQQTEVVNKVSNLILTSGEGK